MTAGEAFFNEVKEAIRAEGLVVEEVTTGFMGAVKEIKKPKFFATYTRDGQRVLIKTMHQHVSGSTADKIVAFYINMSEAPFDRVLIVVNNTFVRAFEPYLEFFEKREWTLDKVQVIAKDELISYLRR